MNVECFDLLMHENVWVSFIILQVVIHKLFIMYNRSRFIEASKNDNCVNRSIDAVWLIDRFVGVNLLKLDWNRPT